MTAGQQHIDIQKQGDQIDGYEQLIKQGQISLRSVIQNLYDGVEFNII